LAKEPAKDRLAAKLLKQIIKVVGQTVEKKKETKGWEKDKKR
jgi:hypothetical protein